MATKEEKQRARYLTKEAIRKGFLIKEPCEICSADAETHHEDYSDPLATRWLCRTHHIQQHMATGGWGPKPLPKPEKQPIRCPCCSATLPDEFIRKAANADAARKKRPGARGLIRNPAGRPAKQKPS